jgi:hypothetical protein
MAGMLSYMQCPTMNSILPGKKDMAICTRYQGMNLEF